MGALGLAYKVPDGLTKDGQISCSSRRINGETAVGFAEPEAVYLQGKERLFLLFKNKGYLSE